MHCSHLGANGHPAGGFIKSIGEPSIGINLELPPFNFGIDFNNHQRSWEEMYKYACTYYQYHFSYAG